MERERRQKWSASQDVARAAAELAGPITPAPQITGSVIGHADPYFDKFLGVPAVTNFLKNPACER